MELSSLHSPHDRRHQGEPRRKELPLRACWVPGIAHHWQTLWISCVAGTEVSAKHCCRVCPFRLVQREIVSATYTSRAIPISICRTAKWQLGSPSRVSQGEVPGHGCIDVYCHTSEAHVATTTLPRLTPTYKHIHAHKSENMRTTFSQHFVAAADPSMILLVTPVLAKRKSTMVPFGGMNPRRYRQNEHPERRKDGLMVITTLRKALLPTHDAQFVWKTKPSRRIVHVSKCDRTERTTEHAQRLARETTCRLRP